MTVLLDTHNLIWVVSDDDRLPNEVKEMVFNDTVIYYSLISVWEIAIKHTVHPDKIPYSSYDFETACKESGFRPLPFISSHIYEMEHLHQAKDAPKHRDPFDRMLLAQAKAENIKLVTHDSLIATYQEACVMLV